MHDARAVAEDAADRASKGADDRFTAMERALLGETPWDTRRRLVGIGLVVLGVALATVAAVAS